MRKTPERYEILRAAGLANGIFTIDGLMKIMQEEGTFQVSRATVFNTMELFCDAGLVIKHPLATAAHYELRTTGKPCYNIVFGSENVHYLTFSFVAENDAEKSIYFTFSHFFVLSCLIVCSLFLFSSCLFFA